MTDKIHALPPMLGALHIKQTVTFDEALGLITKVAQASGSPMPPFELSGNQWCALANLAVDTFGHRANENKPAPVQQEPVAFIDMREWPPIRWRDGMVRKDVARFDGQGLFFAPPAQRKQVGDSRFESWFSEDFDPKGKGTKQQMREAYEAGMNDPPPQPAQPQQCARSHPHENMDAMCELRTEIARLANENARLKAQPAPVQQGPAWRTAGGIPRFKPAPVQRIPESITCPFCESEHVPGWLHDMKIDGKEQ